MAWQRVIHGECGEYRRTVAQALIEKGSPKTALRFALCGAADHVVTDGTGTWIVPRGCGHKLCPRCGRKSGRRMVRRLCQWIGAEAHGDIFTLCCTQRTDPDETLVAARARMVPKVRRLLRVLKSMGMTAGMRADHIVASGAGRGWHYHVHLLLEFPGGRMTPDVLRRLYVEAAGREFVQAEEDASRLVVAAGPAIPEALTEDGQMDFWREARSAILRAIQYPVRDLAQGLTASRLGKDGERLRECVGTLLRDSSGWKLRHTFGRWRKAPVLPAAGESDGVEADQRTESTSGAAKRVRAAGGKATGLGSVIFLYRQARTGDVGAKEVFRDLEGCVANASEFARRYVDFCRRAWDGPGLDSHARVSIRSADDGP